MQSRSDHASAPGMVGRFIPHIQVGRQTVLFMSWWELEQVQEFSWWNAAWQQMETNLETYRVRTYQALWRCSSLCDTDGWNPAIKPLVSSSPHYLQRFCCVAGVKPYFGDQQNHCQLWSVWRLRPSLYPGIYCMPLTLLYFVDVLWYTLASKHRTWTLNCGWWYM